METSGQSFCQGRQSIKLGDRFRIDGAKPSCADYHPKVLNNLGNGPQKSKELQQKQHTQWKADEVVRYMSNLPTYLERGEKHKDKTFNVGVLEWRRLEKWQYIQQHVPTQSCRSSTSSSNASSFSSTEGTSSYSSRGHSCSPARQRPHHAFLDSNLNASPRTPKPSDRNGHSCSPVRQRSHHTVLESSLNASPSKVYSCATKTSDRNGLKHNLVDIPSDYLKLQQSILKTHQSFNKYTENKPKECKNNLALHPTSNDGRLQQEEKQFSASGSKGKLKVQDGEVLEEKENLQGLSDDHSDPCSVEGQQKVVVLLPKDGQDIRYPACPKKSDSAGKYDQEAIETSRWSSIDEPILKFAEGSSGLSCSCPHSGEVDTLSLLPSLARTKGIKFPSDLSQSIPYSARLSFSPVKSKDMVEKMPIKKLSSSSEVPNLRTEIEESSCKVNGLSSSGPGSFPFSCENNSICEPQNQIEQPSSTRAKCLKFPPEMSQSTLNSGTSPVTVIRGKNLEDKSSPKKLKSAVDVPKLSVEEDFRVRHPSPVRRFSFSMGKIGRNSSSNNSCIQSIHPTGEVRSGGAETSVLSADSSCDKSNATGKGRSSPLRRLLDPLLKPRAGNSDADSRQRDSAQIDKSYKFSGNRGEASTLHSVKVKLDLGSCKSINIDHPRDLGKCGSTMVQALLQVAVKNGLPLFTFAVDNSSDILAATMKKLTSGRKDGNNLIYTFFAVHEMKKKNGNWLSQGSKEKNHDYVSDIVGQMKVSDVPNSSLTKQNSVDQCSIKEFVLLAANARQTNQQVPELQANDELAAIVVKLPKITAKLLSDGGKKQSYSRKVSGNLKESHLEGHGRFDCRDAEGSGSSSGSIDPLGLTVILPGGDHGVPSEGKPSSLIQRWRLGGLCDCGGWDVGCRLRVFASEPQFNRGSSSNKSQSSAKKFQLYSQQEQVSDRKPIFSLSPFKDGIYSIEFDPSLKLLQAFSICIAILNGLKPAEFSELTHFFEKKLAEETTLPTTDGANVSNRDLEEIPACFVACPPGSPVARA